MKFKGKFGGSGTPAIMKAIEDELGAGAMPSSRNAAIEEIDLKRAYVEAISRFADLAAIAKANFRFAVDSMYGSGRGVLAGIFNDHGIRHLAIRQELNPLFPDINPEPILPHVAMLQQTVMKEGCDAGLATDGDADRIGAVAETAALWILTKFFPFSCSGCWYERNRPGEVVRAFNTTRMVDRIAAKHGRKNEATCPIGFRVRC